MDTTSSNPGSSHNQSAIRWFSVLIGLGLILSHPTLGNASTILVSEVPGHLSVSAAVANGAVTVTGSATFGKYTWEDTDTHVSWTTNAGKMTIWWQDLPNLGNLFDMFNNVEGGITQTVTADICSPPDGTHTVVAHSEDQAIGMRPTLEATQTVTINQAPDVTVLEPTSVVTKPFDIRARVGFKPAANRQDGARVELDLDGVPWLYHTAGLEGTVEVSLKQDTGQLINPLTLAEGTHTVKVVALACNFARKEVTSTFDVRRALKLEKASPDDRNNQEGPINSTLPKPLIVKVTDGSGKAMAGVELKWTITGPPGATGQMVSGASATGADGKAQATVMMGDKPDTYTITATCPQCTSGSPQTFTAKAIGCEGLDLELSPTDLWPAGTEGFTQSLVTAKVAKPAPPGGCLVKFDVEPTVSKGHDHGTHPKEKAGKVSPDSCTIEQDSTFCPVVYTAPEISGEEKITAKLMAGNQAQETKDATIRIRVPDLEALTDSAIGSWRLTGQTGSHGQNHYGTVSTSAQIRAMATDYYDLYQQKESIGINDMSLEWGGLFDWQATWAPPHDGHRTGHSVDIDRCAQSLVKQNKLDIFAELHFGTRTVEKALEPPKCEGPANTYRIHYDFP